MYTDLLSNRYFAIRILNSSYDIYTRIAYMFALTIPSLLMSASSTRVLSTDSLHILPNTFLRSSMSINPRFL